MVYLIAAFAVGFIGCVLRIIGTFLGRQVSSFEKNKRRGTAEVIGCQRAEDSRRRYVLMVRILEKNDGKTYLCEGKGILASKYPKGTIVNVLYAEHTVLGIPVTEVHLLHAPPADATAVTRVIKGIATGMLLIAVCLMIAGIITLI